MSISASASATNRLDKRDGQTNINNLQPFGGFEKSLDSYTLSTEDFNTFNVLFETRFFLVFARYCLLFERNCNCKDLLTSDNGPINKFGKNESFFRLSGKVQQRICFLHALL